MTTLAVDQLPIGLPIKEGLPPGLSLTSDGRLVGMPTEVGIYIFTVELKSPSGEVTTRRLTMAVH